MDYDAGRGGYGSILQKEMEVRRRPRPGQALAASCATRRSKSGGPVRPTASVQQLGSVACGLRPLQVRQQMMDTMAEEMSYGAMGGYVAQGQDGGQGGEGGDAPMRFDRGDSDDER